MNFSEVKYQPQESKAYLGSPSLVRLPDGAIIAGHDYFGALCDTTGETVLSSIYRSEDDGATWANITHLVGAFWGTLFLHNNALYHISISREYGDVLIRRSNDGGFTWTVPGCARTGLLFPGGKGRELPNWHFGGATPVFVHNGRIYKAVENFVCPEGMEGWNAAYFRARVISAPVDADLLNAASWTMSNEVPFDAAAFDDPELAVPGHNGWLEGSVTVDPQGKLVSIMRIQLQRPNKAAILSLSDDGKELAFDYRSGLVEFIGGHSRFTVRRDERTGLYFTLTNEVGDAHPWSRNCLVLAASDDLRNWRKLETLMTDDSGLEPEESHRLTGFQYPDWQFDGDDIIYLVRMGYRGAHNYHDSNRIGFCKIQNFRNKAGK